MARILVLDGHSPAALAFTRSAGHAQHWVAVGANRGQFAAAKLSRYCKTTLDYPVSTDNVEAFLDAVREFAVSNSVELIVPVTDWTLLPLSDHRERFHGVCWLALPPESAVKVASDKYQTVAIAQSLGISVPRTWLVRNLDDLPAASDLRFPVVVKDRASLQWVNGRGVFGSVAYADKKESLERKVADRLKVAGEVLLQEFVSGTGIGFSCFATDQDLFLPFGWERIREIDPRGSASSCRKAISLDPRLAKASGELIQKIGFKGIAMVEYKKAGDGPAILMEINGRPWGSIALAIASGIDYPRYLIDWWLTGTQPPKQIDYQPGITCRRVVGELTHLNNVRLGKPDKWPGEYPSFWRTLAKVAVPWYPGMHYDDLWFSDPQPGLAWIEDWFRSRLRKRFSGVDSPRP